jgi:hypothetical protein
MILNIYSVYDQCARAYNQPFYVQNDAMALRAFADNVNRDDTTINKTPEHFSLHCLGHFDDATGLIEPLDSPQFIGSAMQVRTDVDQEEFAELCSKLDQLHGIVNQLLSEVRK